MGNYLVFQSYANVLPQKEKSPFEAQHIEIFISCLLTQCRHQYGGTLNYYTYLPVSWARNTYQLEAAQTKLFQRPQMVFGEFGQGLFLQDLKWADGGTS